MFKWSLTFVAVMLAVVGALLVQSSDTAAQNAQTAPASPAPTAYNPGVGELMNLIVQLRHTKLWLAGHEGNWVLAEYESKELRSALANVAKVRPVFRQQSVADNVEMFLGGALRAMDEAVRDRDSAKFTEAYATVTAGCNACHSALGQSQVVIKTPEQPMYPDQEFRPRK
jgi:hypothetical protein